jgi:hypothetical protein
MCSAALQSTGEKNRNTWVINSNIKEKLLLMAYTVVFNVETLKVFKGIFEKKNLGAVSP